MRRGEKGGSRIARNKNDDVDGCVSHKCWKKADEECARPCHMRSGSSTDAVRAARPTETVFIRCEQKCCLRRHVPFHRYRKSQ